jgi:ATP-dependent DNA helicase RecG
VDFKPDQPLPDLELVEAVVGLANSQGGLLLLGIEEDGTVSGLHQSRADIFSLSALVAKNTVAPISVRVESREIRGRSCALIQVPKSFQVVSTLEGSCRQRRVMFDGSPKTLPFYPREIMERQSSMGLFDPSALALENISLDQLEPIGRLQIRKAIKNYHGEKWLLELSDPELDQALGLCREINGINRPTVAGLLFLGTEKLIRQYIPAYEVAFQVIKGTKLKVNEFFHGPLIETFEKARLLFRAQVEEEEIQIGLFRVPAPNYDQGAFREALVNALAHRDLLRLGTVFVRLSDQGLHLSNPGGFIEGLGVDNLLVAQPGSRNPLLANILKRLGLAESSGRGIDRIFAGTLRYGRPAPDYSSSDQYTVSVDIPSGPADFDFLKMVLKLETKQWPLPIDTLLILSTLRGGRSLSLAKLAKTLKLPKKSLQVTLEKLVEMAYLEERGSGPGPSYALSALVYDKSSQHPYGL